MWTWHTNLHFGLISLLVHDFKNHAACFRGPLWGGMDGDGLLCGPRVFLPMDVYPVGKEPGAIAHRHQGQDPRSSPGPHQPTYSTDTDRQGVVISTFATSAISQGSKQCWGSCVPNLNSLQLHLEGSVSDRRAMGQGPPANLVVKPVG